MMNLVMKLMHKDITNNKSFLIINASWMAASWITTSEMDASWMAGSWIPASE